MGFLEQKFSIQFPKKGDIEDIYKNNGDGSYSKEIYLGIDFEMDSDEIIASYNNLKELVDAG